MSVGDRILKPDSPPAQRGAFASYKITSETVDANGLQEAAKLVQVVGSDGSTTNLATSAKQDAEALLVGAVNETAPATDTASSGLNGRLQRIAQRIASVITLLAGGLPAALSSGGGVKVGVVDALPAGENHVGEVGGHKTRVTVEKTRPANATAYTAKDAISESTSAGTVWTFTNISRVAAGSGYVVKATVQTDQTTNTEAFRLHLFSTAPTAINDNDPCTAPLYADAAKYVGTVDFPAAKVEGAGATGAYSNVTGNISNSNLPMAFVCAAADRNLYGILETPTGFTPASGQKFSVALVAEND